MCQPSGVPTDWYFNGRTKCCTFQPKLANFLVGGILRDGTPQGRARVLERIAGKSRVTPLGIDRTLAFDLVYARASKAAFGRSEGLLCPYYAADTQTCTIWRHREATCTTWFCKHERGAVGRMFWGDLRSLLASIEQAVARQVLVDLGLGVDALRANLREPGDPTWQEVDDVVDPKRQAELWGPWLGREADLFVACAERASTWGWVDVAALAGPDVRARAAVARDAYDGLATRRVPDRLIVAQYRRAPATSGRARITAYSGYDPLEVPAVLLDALALFDGRSTAEVLAEVEQRLHVRLSTALLAQLVDHGVLLAAPG